MPIIIWILTMEYRYAGSDDAEAIAEFQCAMALETEGKFLDRETVLKGVGAVFEVPERGFYAVAVSDKTVIGSLLITYEWSDWRNKTFWWIQSVYVEPDYRRRGVFSRLFRFVEEQALEKGNVCFIRLYVEQANEAAKKAYNSLGLKYAGYSVLEKEYNET